MVSDGGRHQAKRERLSEAQNHRCAYCGIRFSEDRKSNAAATIDEYQARAHGGHRVDSNQIVACALCNHGRGKLNAMLYFNAVIRLGRYKASIWGRLQFSKRPKKVREFLAIDAQPID